MTASFLCEGNSHHWRHLLTAMVFHEPTSETSRNDTDKVLTAEEEKKEIVEKVKHKGKFCLRKVGSSLKVQTFLLLEY